MVRPPAPLLTGTYHNVCVAQHQSWFVPPHHSLQVRIIMYAWLNTSHGSSPRTIAYRYVSQCMRGSTRVMVRPLAPLLTGTYHNVCVAQHESWFVPSHHCLQVRIIMYAWLNTSHGSSPRAIAYRYVSQCMRGSSRVMVRPPAPLLTGTYHNVCVAQHESWFVPPHHCLQVRIIMCGSTPVMVRPPAPLLTGTYHNVCVAHHESWFVPPHHCLQVRITMYAWLNTSHGSSPRTIA